MKESLEKLEQCIEELYTERDEKIDFVRKQPIAMPLIDRQIIGIKQKYQEKIDPLERKRKYTIDKKDASNITIHTGKGDAIAGNKYVNNQDGSIRNKYWWYLVIPLAVMVIGYVINEGTLPKILNFIDNSRLSNQSINIATSTILLSEVLSKALSYDTVVEQQDFLDKYKGIIVGGESTVTEVSRASSDFLIDFNVNRQLITCWLPGNEENERKFILMKGKKIKFEGVFSFTNVYGHGLGLDNCDLEQI